MAQVELLPQGDLEELVAHRPVELLAEAIGVGRAELRVAEEKACVSAIGGENVYLNSRDYQQVRPPDPSGGWNCGLVVFGS